jgi:methionyl-tRNA formyltransferase
MGTPAFAVPTLDALLTRHDVAAVYTRPDRASGRGRRIVASPVRTRAEQAGVPVEQPATLRDAEAARTLEAYGPDVVVVAAYGAILPPEVLMVPPRGCINVHASLLPRWRGAAPIQRAILAGDRVAGVSIMRMEAGLDTGPWCIQASVPLDGLTATDATEELAHLGAGVLSLALDGLHEGTLLWTEQDESLVTYAEKVTAADVAITPILTADELLRRVRASGPSAPARLNLAGRMLVVLEASHSTADLAPGEASCTDALDLGVADGVVRLDSVVPEGRSRMSGAAYARGARLGAQCPWSAS